MGEVAANIESRVSLEDHLRALNEKASKSELSLLAQEKVSFADLKRHLGNLERGVGSDGLSSQNLNPTSLQNQRQMDYFEEELARLRSHVEDAQHQIMTLNRQQPDQSSSFGGKMGQKLAEIEEKLTEKANK